MEIPEQSVLHAVDPSMDRERLLPVPGIPDNGGLADVGNLLDDVEFAESGQLGSLPVLGFQEREVLLKNIVDMTEPVVGKSDAIATESGQHAATPIVTADDDMPDLEDIDGELDDRQGVKVGVGDDVGHVAVDENLAGGELDKFLSRHPAVGAPDPEIFGILLDRQFLEKPRVSGPLLGGPSPVPVKEFR